MYLQGFPRTLVTSQGPGTSLTAAAAASALPLQAKFTLPANFFDSVGQQLLVKASDDLVNEIPTRIPGTLAMAPVVDRDPESWSRNAPLHL